MEVSTVNLQRGQFWIFNRVGFYGKGGWDGLSNSDKMMPFGALN